MADNLNMNGLSLNDSKHAGSMAHGRSTYIPPHLRSQGRSGPLMSLDGAPPAGGNPGLGGSAWGNQEYVLT